MGGSVFNMLPVLANASHCDAFCCSAAGSVRQLQVLHQQVAGLQHLTALFAAADWCAAATHHCLQQRNDVVQQDHQQRVEWLEQQNALLQQRVTALEQGPPALEQQGRSNTSRAAPQEHKAVCSKHT